MGGYVSIEKWMSAGMWEMIHNFTSPGGTGIDCRYYELFSKDVVYGVSTELADY